METDKIVLDMENATSEERDLAMLQKIEKLMNTGPIIGEARDVILSLSRNLMVRDLIITSMGVPDKDKERMFVVACEMMDERDEKILKERNGK